MSKTNPNGTAHSHRVHVFEGLQSPSEEPTLPDHMKPDVKHPENISGAGSRPLKDQGKECPALCQAECQDSCPMRCCKPCPINCTAKCHQSCPKHCCSPVKSAQPFPLMNTKLQQDFFRQMAERFCPRACTKNCDPNTCPPICCDKDSSTPKVGPRKEAQSKGTEVVKNALSWFGMMNLLNMMYGMYGGMNRNNSLPFINQLKSQMANDAGATLPGMAAVSAGKDNAKENFLLNPNVKCPTTCGEVCSPLCPPHCCTKAEAKPEVKINQCPPTCKLKCSKECSPNCCMAGNTELAEHPMTGAATLSPAKSHPVMADSPSAAAPTQGTQTAPLPSSTTSTNSPAVTTSSQQAAHLKCSPICPAYCYPECSSSCCTGSARPNSQTSPPQTVTSQVGHPLKVFPPAQPESKPPCPPECAKRCSVTCSKECCMAMSHLVSQPAAPALKNEIRVTCPGECNAKCYPTCAASCCTAAKVAFQSQGTNLPQYSIRVPCPAACRSFNCLFYCHHDCCLRNSIPNKLNTRSDVLKRNLKYHKIQSSPTATLGSFHNNMKVNKLHHHINYSLGKSKRKSISRHHSP